MTGVLPLPDFTPELKNISLFCKRDDLYQPLSALAKSSPNLYWLTNSAISGNKARKLYYYLKPWLSNYQKTKLSEFGKKSIKQIVSYGSLQSNAMVALSELALLYQVPFYYYAKPPPKSIRSNHISNISRNKNSPVNYGELTNYEKALANKMVHIHHDLSQEKIFLYKHMQDEHPEAEVFLEGAASFHGGEGYEELAKELYADGVSNTDIVLTAGTGLSGYLLKRSLSKMFEQCNEKEKMPRVFIAPAFPQKLKKINHNYNQTEKKSFSNYTSYVKNYLAEMLSALELLGLPGLSFEDRYYPEEIYPPNPYTFATPHSNLYEIFIRLQIATDITFDLLYDSVGWLALIHNAHLFTNRKVIYLHQGGVGGNIALLRRYRHLNIIYK